MRILKIQVVAGLLSLISAGFAFPQAIEVSLPDSATGDPDSSVTIPIEVGDLTGRDVIAYQTVVVFDTTVLTATGASSAGTISEPWGSPTVNTTVPGQINVGGFGTAPLSGSGTLVNLEFDVVGDPGDTTDLVFVNFIFNAGNPPAATLDGMFTVIGEEPDIEVVPDSHDYGNVTVDSSASQTFMVSNAATATADLDVTATTLVGADVGEFSIDSSGAPFTLAPGASQSVVVSFNPTSEGPKSAKLRINSNDPDENPFDVLLSGTGVSDGDCDPFACAESAVIFPMPEGGVKGDPVEGSDGDTIWVEIQIKDNPQPIGAFGFIVQVDPAQLDFISAQAGDLTGGFVVIDGQENSPGVITCGGFGTTPVPVGSAGSLIRLRFVVSCAEGDSSDITISNLSDDVVGLTACCNRFYCVVCREDGDVNNDGNLTPGDALCAFKTFLNGQTVPADCDIADWDCEVIAGDVNCDGTVTPGDALSIFQRFLSGLPPEECFAQAGLSLSKRSSRAEPYRLSLVQRTVLQSAQASGRDLIELSLRVDHPEGLAAFGLGLSYPAEKLDFLGIRRTALTQEWIELDGQVDQLGELLIGGFNIDPVETVATGDLFELTFVSKGQPIRADEFGVIELTDDLSDALLSAQASGLAGVAIVPTVFKLYQSYPNPFQGHSAQDAVIRFDLAGSEAMQVELSIYNITGQLVRRLVTGSRTPGQYEISWDGRNDSGLQLPSGTYFYRLKAADFVQSRYLSVVR